MLQWFIKFPEFIKFPIDLGKTRITLLLMKYKMSTNLQIHLLNTKTK